MKILMEEAHHLWPGPMRIGDIVEYPFRTGQTWKITGVGTKEMEIERTTILKRYRPPNTHKYQPKKRKTVSA